MRIRDTSTVYAYAITLCMGSFVFGYELSSFSNLSQAIASYNKEDNPSSIAHLMTYFNILFGVSTLVGIIFYNYFKQYGWILTFRVTDILTIVAAVIGVIDLSIASQTWSRILFGFVTGINTILIPTFLTSILPGVMGAPAGTLNQFFIVLGIFMGIWIGNLLIGNSSSVMMWRIIVGLPILAALIRQKCLAEYFPYQALQIYMQSGDDESLQHYLNRIYQDTTIAQFKESKQLTDDDILQETASLCHSHSHFYRVRLAVALAIAALNQLSGGAALAYFINHYDSYSPQQKLNMLASVNLLQLIVTLFSGQFLQKYGRRAFMQEGQKIIIITLLLVGVLQIVVPQYGTVCLILIFIHMVGFSLSYGPCTFLIGTEVINDIFYPALMQWTLITFNFVAVEPLIQLLGLGTLSLIYCLFQIFAYFYLESFQVQTQGKLRRNVYRQYRQLKYSSPRIEQPNAEQELKQKDSYDLNDGYFPFKQPKQ